MPNENSNRNILTGVIAALIALAIVAVAYFYLGGNTPAPDADEASEQIADTATPATGNIGVATGEVQIGVAPYTLTDMNGGVLTQDSFPGKYKLVFFGFTSCQDICPISMHNIADALAKLGPDAAKVQPIFISVDPKRDTPDVIKKWLANFDARIMGATGTPEQIKAATDSFRAYASDGGDAGTNSEGEHQHQDNGQGDGTEVNHSDSIYLLSPQNGLLNVFNGDTDGATLASDIQTVLAAAMIPADGSVPTAPANGNDVTPPSDMAPGSDTLPPPAAAPPAK